MNLNHLQYFYILCDELSFSQTARRLRIAQSAVSSAIKKLEEDLGVQLFLRQNRRVVLTPEGERLKAEAGSALANIHQVVTSLRGDQKKMRGVLRIGSLQEFGELILAPLISSFTHMHPDIAIEVTYASNASLVDKLQANTIDLHFGINTPMPHSIKSQQLLKQEAFLVTSSATNNKIPPSELFKSPFIAYQPNDPLLMLYLKTFYPKHSFESVNLKFICNSHKTMVALIQQNTGTYAVLPQLSEPVFHALKDGAIQRVRQHALNSHIYVYYWHRDHIPRTLSAFLEHANGFDYKNLSIT